MRTARLSGCAVAMVLLLLPAGGHAQERGTRVPSAGPIGLPMKSPIGQTVSGLVDFQMVVVETAGVPGYRAASGRAEGDPLTGVFDVRFTIFDHWETGRALWTELQEKLPLNGGILSTKLGTVNPIGPNVFTSPWRWLEVEIGGKVVTPRILLTSVPYAFRARDAEKAQFAGVANVCAFAQTAADDGLPLGATVLSRTAQDQGLLAKGYQMMGSLQMLVASGPLGREGEPAEVPVYLYEKVKTFLEQRAFAGQGWLVGGSALELGTAAQAFYQAQQQSTTRQEGGATTAPPDLPLKLGLYFLLVAEYPDTQDLVTALADLYDVSLPTGRAGTPRGAAAVYPVVYLSQEPVPFCLRPHTAKVDGFLFVKPTLQGQLAEAPAVDQTKAMIEDCILNSAALETASAKYAKVEPYLDAMVKLLSGDANATLKSLLVHGFVWATTVDTTTVNQYAPVAYFEPPAQTAAAGVKVSFDASKSIDFDSFSSTGLTYKWDFAYPLEGPFAADLEKQNDPLAEWTYPQASLNAVKLVVSDGTKEGDFTGGVTVTGPGQGQPTASFAWTGTGHLGGRPYWLDANRDGKLDEALTFNASASTPSPDKTITAYAWDWNNDGTPDFIPPNPATPLVVVNLPTDKALTTGTGPTQQHYYVIKLTVTDSSGASNTTAIPQTIYCLPSP